jgi:class 3 adenylate cyclase
MSTAYTYLPIDRRHALAANKPLPTTLDGTALFADMSGFTALTEVHANELGVKRGAEELTVHLNRVYDALIDELHRFGGSVIGFSGDAITCWLDGDDGRRAVACGLAMQTTMAQFAQVRTHAGRSVALGIKVAIATGQVRRIVVGNPDYRLIDVVAGEPQEQMSSAESLAASGDVVVHRSTVAALGESSRIKDWLADDVARVAALNVAVVATGWPEGEETTGVSLRLSEQPDLEG